MNYRQLITALIFFVLFCPWIPVDAQWIRINGLENKFIKTWLIHDNTIYAGGHWSALYRSTDRGTTWSKIPLSSRPADTILALAGNRSFVFAGTNGWGLYRTSNRGDSWSQTNGPRSGGWAIGSLVSHDTTIFAASFRVWRSTDHGNSWMDWSSGLPSPPLSHIQGLAFDGSRLFAALDFQQGVYLSPADNPSWKPVGLTGMWDNLLAAIDTNVFAGTSSGVHLYSGSGTTWLPRNNGLPSGSKVYALVAVRRTLFVGVAGGVYKSENLGQSWQQVNDPNIAGLSVYALGATETDLLAATNNGSWRRSLSEVTSVEDIGQVPQHFHLYQNYPNPFNPSTEIRYQASEVSHVSLKVYDVLGREVATLVDGEVEAGHHRVQWNAEGLPSGVYFYRLEAGSFVRTKRMVFVR